MVEMISIVIIVIVIFLFVLFSKITISVKITYLENQQKGSVHIMFLKIPIYKKKIKPESDEKQSTLDFLTNRQQLTKLFHEIKFFLKTVRQTSPQIHWILQKMTIHKFQWHTNFGAGEASSTGMLTGGVWSIKGIVLAFLRETCHAVNSLHVNVSPYFQQALFQTQLDVKVTIRFVYAISGGWKLLRSMSSHNEQITKLRERKI